MRRLAQTYQMALVTFEGHDLDEDFLAGHHDHLTDKGWLYFDKAIDDFYHDRQAVPRQHVTVRADGLADLKNGRG